MRPWHCPGSDAFTPKPRIHLVDPKPKRQTPAWEGQEKALTTDEKNSSNEGLGWRVVGLGPEGLGLRVNKLFPTLKLWIQKLSQRHRLILTTSILEFIKDKQPNPKPPN